MSLLTVFQQACTSGIALEKPSAVYGSTTIELASGVAGGKENTCQAVLSLRAAAIVPRRVEIADITRPDRLVLSGPQVTRVHGP